MPPVSLPSIQQLDRYRLWALLQAVEEDLRLVWLDEVVRTRPEEDYLGGYLAKARDNLKRGGDDEVDYDESLVSFLDLGDVIDLLAANASEFADPEIASSLRRSVENLKAVLPVRHRLAHHRPLPVGGIGQVLESLDRVAEAGLPLKQVAFVATQLRMDPDWLPGGAIHAQPWEPVESVVLHNVPLPEHEDTGLIGRKRDVDSLFRMLKERRYPAFTILGPGGTGKTALALEVLWRFIDEGDPYEVILYASLKTERLTVSGIQRLASPILTVSDALDAIVEPLSEDLEGSIAALASALEGIPALLVLDNLETDIGSDIEELSSQLPRDTTLLMTSRIGLPSGFGDRAHSLQPLSPKSAAHLFRSYARARNQSHLAAISDERIELICDRLGRSPLGIRWLVSSVEAGVRIEAILEETTDLITFCVGNVFMSLSDEAKTVAAALAVEPAPTSERRLSLLTGESNLDRVRLSVRELQAASLAAAVADPDGYEAFSLTEMALAHVDQLVEFQTELDEVRKEAARWDATEERMRRDESKLLNPNTVRVHEPADRDSALLLRQALLTIKRDPHRAMEEISTARSMSPDFYETERVAGFADAFLGHHETALEHYSKAIELAPDAGAHARCEYHMANQLVQMHRAHDALSYAQSAHSELDQDGTRFLLARLHLFTGQSDKAISLLERISETATGRLRVMALTAHVDAYKRQSEELRRDSRPREALEKSLSGLEVYATRSLVEDRRLHETAIECANEGLGAVVDMTDPQELSEGLQSVLTSLKNNPAWNASKERPYVVRNLERLKEGVGGELADRVAVLLSGRKTVRDANRVGRVVARVDDFNPDKGFGFAVNGDETRYFFHRSDVVEESDVVFLHGDAEISFRADPEDRSTLESDKYQVAHQIEVHVPNASRDGILEDRIGLVVYADRDRVIVRDTLSGATATTTRRDLPAGIPFSNLVVGASVAYSLDEGPNGWLIGFRTRRGDFRYTIRPQSVRLLT